MTDREIKEALAVDPSPEFVARVRTRIAREPVAAARRLGWWVAAAAMAAAAIVGAVVSRPARPVPSLAPLTARGAVGMSLPMSLRPDVRLPPSPNGLRRTGKPDAPSTTSTLSSQLEVLLDPVETLALRALIAGVREGRIDLTPAIEASTPSVMELEPIRDLVIAPIVIAPVEGVRQ